MASTAGLPYDRHTWIGLAQGRRRVVHSAYVRDGSSLVFLFFNYMRRGGMVGGEEGEDADVVPLPPRAWQINDVDRKTGRRV